jgi:hypothetical protein
VSDILATLLGFGFTLVVCLLALQALLSPLLRGRRTRNAQRSALETESASQPETTPVHP